MIEQSEVRQVVDDHFKLMRWALQLQAWDFAFDFNPGEDCATCKPEPAYLHALIAIRHNNQVDEADVLDSLRHEMMHCFIADFETYRKAVHQLIDDPKVLNALDEVFTVAQERTVGRLERMLDHGLGLQTAQMLKHVRKRVDKEGYALD